MGDGPAVDRQWRAGRGDDPAGDRARTGDRDLLADDSPHRRLERVHAARHAQSGPSTDEWPEDGVAVQRPVDGDGVGVEIEQPANPPHRVVQVALVDDAHVGAEPRRRRREHGHAVPVREIERAVERPAIPRLDARHRTSGEKGHEVVGVERRACGEVQLHAGP